MCLLLRGIVICVFVVKGYCDLCVGCYAIL